MTRKFYILNHPERVFVKENCTYFEKVDNLWINKEGEIVIPVDSLNDNQDPYVFNNPWFYGYCKNALLPGNMGEGSGIVFGRYNQHNEGITKDSFLLDTIFITDYRFYWIDKNGNSPSMEFILKYPIMMESKNYKDFIEPRIKDKQHPKAKFIFTSRTLNCETNINTKSNISDNKDYFSCIPLFKDGNGMFKLIDILPIILKHNAKQFKGFKYDPKKLYEIENSMLKDIFKYVLEEANILVTNTQGKGSPTEPDIELQYKYYKEIYSESNTKKINHKCKKICKIKDCEKNSLVAEKIFK